ncbi:hypothetical protein V9T40_011323 [Parthenolecanium corni]|uniref:Ig-like domain-containing protein n=1 Tax=Parthenolecanium corni TaxID=536013 RepID=A0AAN9TIG9_9HEMI
MVAWIKVSSSSQTILTTHQYVITNDSRISLSYNDHRSWYLHIREVKEDDRGWYICQVNTEPITSQSMYLQVLVPPKIMEDMTSNDVVVREMTDVTLHCRAVGYPEPYVMWRRGDGYDFIYNGEKVNVVDGEKLQFRKISRLHMGTYYCIAQNSILPPANKKISLIVHFPPILHVPNQLVGASLNQQVTLHCISEAYPKSINYWTRENGEMIMPESKYEVIYKHDMYTTNMIVNINAVSSSDFGTYTCVSINPLGNTDGVIKLYVMDDEIAQLNSTSTATKCRLDTLAASLLCILSEVYKITKRYLLTSTSH